MDFLQALKNEIDHNGPITIHHFMQQCVLHYYSSQQVFGRDGDFVTSPEISQMFGEMIGAWCADIWAQMGSPKEFRLVECGPGQGTLMADILRATKSVPGFHEAMIVVLVENSKALRQRQLQTLEGVHITWYSDWPQIEGDSPMIMITNEFLDALPIHQLQYQEGRWRERVVGLSAVGELTYGLAEPHPVAIQSIPEGLPAPQEGDILEVSPSRKAFVDFVDQQLSLSGGAALYIDYGHLQSAYGDTLQAMKSHEYVHVLPTAGEADLTSHVDFAALQKQSEFLAHYTTTQGAFLKALGIGVRAEALKQNATPEQAKDIDSALKRLCDNEEMGQLFKVLSVASINLKPAGF